MPAADPALCDVLIIGGGPAGSTAAALLAERGRDVVVLEKEHHPRFHVGESLLPRNLEIFERLGMRDAIAAMGVLKPGAEFVSDQHETSAAFSFANGIDQVYTFAYQVKRAEFDEALFRNANRHGARLVEGVTVRDVTLGNRKSRALVKAILKSGRETLFSPRFVIDASGRNTFLAAKLKIKVSDKRNNTAAVFAHFRGAECRVGEREGYITVHLVEDGWFWMIPLPNHIMSVGFVGTPTAFRNRDRNATKFLMARISESPSMQSRMKNAEMIIQATTTGNYSYRSRKSWGDGYLLIGDAFGFIDPIFSSGVLLAMMTGEAGAASVDAWLECPHRGESLARQMENETLATMRMLSWLIYRINRPVLRDMFMMPHNRFRMREGLISLLAGNVGSQSLISIPVLAFKSVYYALSVARYFGFRLGVNSQVDSFLA